MEGKGVKIQDFPLSCFETKLLIFVIANQMLNGTTLLQAGGVKPSELEAKYARLKKKYRALKQVKYPVYS